jgi:hypothetical protein
MKNLSHEDEEMAGDEEGTGRDEIISAGDAAITLFPPLSLTIGYT